MKKAKTTAASSAANNSVDANTAEQAASLLSLGADLSNTKDANKKRKAEETATDASQEPPDFWFYLPEGQQLGDFDVICGRGGE